MKKVLTVVLTLLLNISFCYAKDRYTSSIIDDKPDILTEKEEYDLQTIIYALNYNNNLQTLILIEDDNKLDDNSYVDEYLNEHLSISKENLTVIYFNKSSNYYNIYNYGTIANNIKEDDLKSIYEETKQNIDNESYFDAFENVISRQSKLTALIEQPKTDISKKYLNDEERTSLDNLGVNKKWDINSNNKSNVLSTKYVDSQLKIYDFSDVLTNEEEEALREKSLEFMEKYNTELIIVTDNIIYYDDSRNEEYAADFYDYNDFGIDFKNYDGIVLFRNTYVEDPYFDMYTFGKAQLYFDQYNYDYILDSIYYNLKNGYHYQGFEDFINLVNQRYEDGIPTSMKDYDINDMGFLYNTKTQKLDKNGNIVNIWIVPYGPAILVGLIISSIVTLILVARNKMVKKATNADKYIDNNSIKYNEKRDVFLRSHTTHYTVSHDSGSSGHSSSGGFSSHSGSSGGGHSSGGGRHG